MDRLIFEVDEVTCEDHGREMSRIKVYESSVLNQVTGEPLVSIATRGPGMRLTEAQAVELRDWLTDWLEG